METNDIDELLTTLDFINLFEELPPNDPNGLTPEERMLEGIEYYEDQHK